MAYNTNNAERDFFNINGRVDLPYRSIKVGKKLGGLLLGAGIIITSGIKLVEVIYTTAKQLKSRR